VTHVFDRALLSCLLFFVGLAMGGGLYETRVVYPNWALDPTPATLSAKLASSGQAAAARRFWPYVSPMAMLLALGNGYAAWHQTGLVRPLWLTASLAIVIKSIVTFSYFAPTMMRRIERAESMETNALRRTVLLWTRLSPMRLVVELIAWVAGMVTLMLL
jgi:hypothetical protein